MVVHTRFVPAVGARGSGYSRDARHRAFLFFGCVPECSILSGVYVHVYDIGAWLFPGFIYYVCCMIGQDIKASVIYK